ncbi:MAG: Hpt domain-containing protein [bacterium]
MSGATIRSQDFDEKRFAGLLELAGPDTALELVERLEDDLRAVEAALSVVARTADMPTLQAQSHVLLGVAGTIGANRLFELAKGLNDVAHVAGSPFPGAMLVKTEVALARVIARIHAARTQLTRAP